jgi:hypothetical protein
MDVLWEVGWRWGLHKSCGASLFVFIARLWFWIFERLWAMSVLAHGVY